MRILFRDYRECDEYRQTLSRIRRWWTAFAAKTDQLEKLFSREAHWDLPAWMHSHLHAIDPRLCWEFGTGLRDGHRLVITPENEKHLRPLVDLILSEAPQIVGWQFFGYRLAESVDAAAASVEGRVDGCIEDVEVIVHEGPLNTVALRFVSPRYVTEDEPEAFKEAFVAVESLLGEQILDKWVGPIATGPIRSDRRALPLKRLRPTVEAIIGRIKEQMPQEPCFQRLDGDTWGTYELKSCEKRNDSGDAVRCDELLAGVTMYWDMIQATANGGAFFSERFSATGETFCYVKIDCSAGLKDSVWADRGQIESALNQSLAPRKLGACIGGGTGARHSYLDLALMDLREGCELVRAVLRQGRAPKRSWVLFFDATMKAEWIGVHDDTPEPMLEVE